MLEDVLVTFAGDGGETLTVLSNDDGGDLLDNSLWQELDDGVAVAGTTTDSLLIDLTRSRPLGEGMPLAPGDSYGGRLAVNDPFSLFIDSVTFTGTAIPEPGAASLLAIASLVALGRRRRN